jgi:hypothetical protein
MATYGQRGQHVTHQYNAEHITTIQGISEERHECIAGELGVTRSALTSFFKILKQQQVPPEDLEHTLRQIATSYKDLHARLQHFTSDDPAVTALKQQARNAVEAGEFAQPSHYSTRPVRRTSSPPSTSKKRLRHACARPPLPEQPQWRPEADRVSLCRGSSLLPAGRRSGGVRPHGEAGIG